MIDPYSRLMANQEKPKKPLISNPSNVDASISQRNSELDERLSALDRYSSSEQPPNSSDNYFSSGVSESGQTQGSVLPSGVRITQAFGAYNPNVEVFSQGGRNWGTDFGVKEGTPLALPPGVWQVMEAYDRASGRGRIGNKENKGYGNSILVRNVETGETLRFSHLSGVNVMPGKTYQGGTVIGASGATGNVTGAHLDLEYKNPQGQYRDILKSPYAQNLFGNYGQGGGGYGRGGGFNMGEIKESISQKFGGLKDQVKAYPEAFMTNLPVSPYQQNALNKNLESVLGKKTAQTAVAQGLNNWLFSPLMKIPYHLREANNPENSGLEKLGHKAQAVFGVMPGVDDVAMAGFNSMKGGLANRNISASEGVKEGLAGNQYFGLGDAVSGGKENIGASALNLMELPLMLLGGMKAQSLDEGVEGSIKSINKLLEEPANKQIIEEVDKMIGVARKQQEGFQKLVSDFSKKVGVDFSIGSIKDRGRIVEKTIKEELGNPKNIKDINRAVVFVDDFNDSYMGVLDDAVDYFGELIKGGGRIKEGLDSPLYKKTIINIPGDKGQLTEVQFTTKKMWDAKIKIGDELYHEWRSIKDSPNFAKQAQKLWEKMYKLYQNAL